jgi:hypothetical protein
MILDRILAALFPASNSKPMRIDYRRKGARAAVVLIHGFSGKTGETWGNLPDILMSDPALSSWDIYALGFPSSLRFDVPKVWSAEPDIELISQGLSTTFSVSPLRSYDALAICAHSMGGLVAQRCLLSTPDLQARLGHLFLFGTPSGGLHKARFLSGWKRQVRDMGTDSGFIKRLREDWLGRYGRGMSFDLRVIAGLNDEFVPASSSIYPFKKLIPSSALAVVPGNHISIVKPMTADHEAVRIIIEALSGISRPVPPVNSALLAVELGQFRRAIDILEPRASQLDDNAIISLSLALDATGRTAEALKVLERYLKRGRGTSSDALGTLGGRLKRRWLVQGNAIDYQRAKEMYTSGLAAAEANDDHAQAYYHAINLAFLELMGAQVTSSPSPHCIALARRALRHCAMADRTAWRVATEGEALLIVGQPLEAYKMYTNAVAMTKLQREIDSMYSQASRVARRMYGEDGSAEIERIFGLTK